jgi:hypothetical protein
MLDASLFFLGQMFFKTSHLFLKGNILSLSLSLSLSHTHTHTHIYNSPKNHKLIFKESIGTIIIITEYNFEETSENVSP